MTEVKKEQVKKEQEKAPVAKKKPIQFYFVRSARRTFRLLDEGITIQAKDKVYVAKPEDPKYDRIVQFLRDNRGNTANGGTDFYEVAKEDATGKSTKAVALDNLLNMDDGQIRKMLKGGVELLAMTKGELILEYMKQQEV